MKTNSKKAGELHRCNKGVIYMVRGWQKEVPTEDRKVKELGGLIAYKMKTMDLDDEIISAKILMKKDTFRKKRKHPETFRYVEVIRLLKVLSFTEEETLKVI